MYLRIRATKTPILQHGYKKEQRGVAGKLEISLDFLGQISLRGSTGLDGVLRE